MAITSESLPTASLDAQVSTDSVLTLAVSGRLDAGTTGKIWEEAVRTVNRVAPQRLVLEASGLDYCDGIGIGLFLELTRLQEKAGRTMEIAGLREEFRQLLELYASASAAEFPAAPVEPPNVIEEIGGHARAIWRDIRMQIEFTGELTLALFRAALRPRLVRWKDALVTAESAGADALPMIAMLGFLLGLIMAFQSAVPLRRFGAQIFVANLVALSMLRELGPLVTAIILAGRSGSAFAAELGTMKVNEEINALITMGLDPVRFLVVSRVIAAVLMTPLLTIFFNLFSLIGCGVVILSMGYPLATYFNQILGAVDVSDLLGGLFKSFVFGILVAGIGCLRGLQTGTGAAAVGRSATRSVVSGIVLIVVADGLFAVIFYCVGI